jgi:hypothetical protein
MARFVLPLRATRPRGKRGLQANLCMLPVDPASAFAFCMHVCCIPNARLNAFDVHSKCRRDVTRAERIPTNSVPRSDAIEME